LYKIFNTKLKANIDMSFVWRFRFRRR